MYIFRILDTLILEGSWEPQWAPHDFPRERIPVACWKHPSAFLVFPSKQLVYPWKTIIRYCVRIKARRLCTLTSCHVTSVKWLPDMWFLVTWLPVTWFVVTWLLIMWLAITWFLVTWLLVTWLLVGTKEGTNLQPVWVRLWLLRLHMANQRGYKITNNYIHPPIHQIVCGKTGKTAKINIISSITVFTIEITCSKLHKSLANLSKLP